MALAVNDVFEADREWSKARHSQVSRTVAARLASSRPRSATNEWLDGDELHHRRSDDGFGARRAAQHWPARFPSKTRRLCRAAATRARHIKSDGRPSGDVRRACTRNLRRENMYIDGFVLPLKEDKLDDYKPMADIFARQGARRMARSDRWKRWATGSSTATPPTSSRRCKAEDGENVVFSFVVWPDKATRDAGWDKMMADPDMQPGAIRCRSTASACSGAASGRSSTRGGVERWPTPQAASSGTN